MPQSNGNTNSTSTPSFKILIEGQQIDSAFRVMSIYVGKEVNRIPNAEITLLDGDAASEDFTVSNADDFIPGKQIEIQAGYENHTDTIFKGIIVKHGIKVLQNESSTLNISAKHKAFTTSLKRNNKVFTDKKDSEIIEDILTDASLDKEIESTSIIHESLVQYNCSDWDFINMRAEANGKLVIANDDKIYIKKPDLSASAVTTLSYGSSILEFEAEMDARKSFTDYKAKTWSQKDQEIKISEESESVVQSSQGNLSVSDLASAIGNNNYDLFIGSTITEQEADEVTKGKILKNNLSKIRGRVKCNGKADIKPGDIITLAGVGERFNGNAFVSALSHSINESNWETDIQFGLNPEMYVKHFDDIVEAPSFGLLPSVSGLQIAKVTQLQDDPDGESRIQIKLPLIGESDNTVWARVATLDAGNERGSFFLPEIDDEVIVGFIDDDPRKAVVLGMLNSSKLPAPQTASDDNNIKGFYTRSKMKIEFDDDKKIITFETPGGNKVVIDDDQKQIALTDQNNNKLTMNQDGITIESGKDIIMKASTGDIKAEGMNIELKASVNMKAEGSASAEIKASGTTTVKGAMVQIN